MYKNIVAVVAIASALFTPGVSQASSVSDTVDITRSSVTSCGAQTVTVSGTGTYSEGTQHLVVTIDGTEVFYSNHEPASWTTSGLAVSEGEHTAVATIYDKSDREDVMAQDTFTFSTSCSTGEDDGGSSDGGKGKEGDCCPGPDPRDVKAKPKVKGVVSSSNLKSLAPLNSVFRSVFDRDPNSAEWHYWANRYLNDKSQWDAIYGAMQYHEMHGHTMGK